MVQVGRDEVLGATVRGETERWAGLYSGPGAASALIHRRRPHPQRDDACTKPAGKPTIAAELTVGFPIACCYSECHSERNSKDSASHLKKPAAGRDLPLTVGFPSCLLPASCPMQLSTSLQPFFTRNCGGCNAQFAVLPDYTRP